MKKWANIEAQTMSPERIARVRKEAADELRALTLRQLREEAGKTRVEMADPVEVTQSALSRLERREDNPIDVLRRYVEVLGGELEVVAVLGNKRDRAPASGCGSRARRRQPRQRERTGQDAAELSALIRRLGPRWFLVRDVHARRTRRP